MAAFSGLYPVPSRSCNPTGSRTGRPCNHGAPMNAPSHNGTRDSLRHLGSLIRLRAPMLDGKGCRLSIRLRFRDLPKLIWGFWAWWRRRLLSRFYFLWNLVGANDFTHQLCLFWETDTRLAPYAGIKTQLCARCEFPSYALVLSSLYIISPARPNLSRR